MRLILNLLCVHLEVQSIAFQNFILSASLGLWLPHLEIMLAHADHLALIYQVLSQLYHSEALRTLRAVQLATSLHVVKRLLPEFSA